MNENPGDSHGFLVRVGRSLGGTRGGEVFVSLAVAGLFSCLAFAAWYARAVAATVLAIGLLAYGLRLAWRLLPISIATRARWEREQQLVEGCPACQFRGLLWAGSGLAIAKLWRSDFTQPVDYAEFILPAVFLAFGTLSYILCCRFIRANKTVQETFQHVLKAPNG